MSDPDVLPPQRPLRILHCPTEVGGNPTGLSRAERELGAESTVAVTHRSRLGYEVDIDLDLGDQSRGRRLLSRAAFTARSLRRYDVYHFNFGQTLLPRIGSWGVDLPLLRTAGKRLFMTFQGCDARQTGYCRKHFRISCCGSDAGDDLCTAAQDADKQHAIRYAERFVHRSFCLNPDLLHVVRGAEFVPYASVDPARVTPAPANGSDRLTILHAPTSRAVKGTSHIVEAVETVQRDHPLDFVLVENVPHAEAMKRYRSADLVIDQLKVGWYGAFAIEMMAMGTPVVCYIRKGDLQFIPDRMREELPIVVATPETLTDVLRDLVGQPERLAEIGERSRRYVERWHDPVRIARRMLEIYRDPGVPFWDEAGVLPER